jgi:hypothetical protein
MRHLIHSAGKEKSRNNILYSSAVRHLHTIICQLSYSEMNPDETQHTPAAELERITLELLRKLRLDAVTKAALLDSIVQRHVVLNDILRVDLEVLRQLPAAETTEAIMARLVFCTYSVTLATVALGWVLSVVNCRYAHLDGDIKAAGESF